jgi:predicted transcriptional regulator
VTGPAIGRDTQHARPELHPRPEIPSENNGHLSRPQVAILKAIAEFEAIGRQQISKSWIAARSGVSSTSSSFSNNLGYLRANGYINYPVHDTAALTEKGRAAAGNVDVPTSSDEMLQSCLALLSDPQRKILQALYEAHPQSIPKDELAQRTGASSTSSAFSNNLGALRSAGMIEYPERGTAKVADWIFVD